MFTHIWALQQRSEGTQSKTNHSAAGMLCIKLPWSQKQKKLKPEYELVAVAPVVNIIPGRLLTIVKVATGRMGRLAKYDDAKSALITPS